MGEVPKDWRKANATPVLRRPRRRTQDYTLVSFPLITGKMIEQLIQETISRQIKDKKVIRSAQHGFTRQKLCFTNSDNILWWSDWLGIKGRVVSVVLHRSFPPHLLCDSLQCCGLMFVFSREHALLLALNTFPCSWHWIPKQGRVMPNAVSRLLILWACRSLGFKLCKV